MNENIYGEFMYKAKWYSWHFIWQPHSIEVWNTAFKEMCRFEIELTLLWDKRKLIERIKTELDKPPRGKWVDYSLCDEIRDDIFEV